jgi:hypothetical protein
LFKKSLKQKNISSNNQDQEFGSSSSKHQVSTSKYEYQPLSTREYRKAFGQFSSSISQRVETLEPIKINLDSQEELQSGSHSIDFDKADIKIKQSGMYMIIAAPQVSRARGSTAHWIDFWIRINNIDLPNSSVRRAVGDFKQKDVVPLNAVTPLKSGDIVNMMMTAEKDDEGLGIEFIEPDGEPSVPSIIVTIVQLD